MICHQPLSPAYFGMVNLIGGLAGPLSCQLYVTLRVNSSATRLNSTQLECNTTLRDERRMINTTTFITIGCGHLYWYIHHGSCHWRCASTTSGTSNWSGVHVFPVLSRHARAHRAVFGRLICLAILSSFRLLCIPVLHVFSSFLETYSRLHLTIKPLPTPHLSLTSNIRDPWALHIL